jgi:hypothetical protein
LFGEEGACEHARMCAGRRSVVALLVSAVALAACGGGSSGTDVESRDTSPSNGTGTQTQPSQSIPDDLQVPKSVPQRATGPAKRSSTRVIRRWLAALDRGDVERAAHYFALPSTFQNTGTPVLHIDSEEERIAVNLSLTCGAKAERTGGAGPYTIVFFRLVERTGPGGGCGSGVGGTARGAILVSGGLIREWYRLPDDPAQAQQDEQQATGPSA